MCLLHLGIRPTLHTDLQAACCRLTVSLTRKRAGSLALVKLIAPEDHMEEHQDMHPDPNIDVAYVSFSGRLFRLPEGLNAS